MYLMKAATGTTYPRLVVPHILGPQHCLSPSQFNLFIFSPIRDCKLTSTNSLVSFPADGIYELDQHVTFPSTSIPLTLTFYAKSNTTGCSIIVVFGIRGGAYFAEKQVQLTTNYAGYSVSGTTDGEMLGFAASEVQCSGSMESVVFFFVIA